MKPGLLLHLALMGLDLTLTALALLAARRLRGMLPFGIYLLEPLRFPPWYAGLVPLV